MKKRIRQYIGLLSAVLAYYAVHEGEHLLYASLMAGLFEETGRFVTMKFLLKKEQQNDIIINRIMRFISNNFFCE